MVITIISLSFFFFWQCQPGKPETGSLLSLSSFALECREQDWHDFIRSLSFSSSTGFSVRRDEQCPKNIKSLSICILLHTWLAARVSRRRDRVVFSWSFSSAVFSSQQILLALIAFFHADVRWMCENDSWKRDSALCWGIRFAFVFSLLLVCFQLADSARARRAVSLVSQSPSLSKAVRENLLHHYWLHVHCLSPSLSLQSKVLNHVGKHNITIRLPVTHTHTLRNALVLETEDILSLSLPLCSCAHRERSGAHGTPVSVRWQRKSTWK